MALSAGSRPAPRVNPFALETLAAHGIVWPDADALLARAAQAARVPYTLSTVSGMSIEEIHGITAIDPWFLDQLQEIVELENELAKFDSLATASRRSCTMATQGASLGDVLMSWRQIEMAPFMLP